MSKWGHIILGVYLVLVGLISVLDLRLGQLQPLVPVLALVAGALILFDTVKGKLSANLGALFLSIWLILTGLIALFRVQVPGVVLGVLALVAGILLLFRK